MFSKVEYHRGMLIGVNSEDCSTMRASEYPQLFDLDIENYATRAGKTHIVLDALFKIAHLERFGPKQDPVGPFSPDHAQQFVTQRGELVNDAATHLRKVREFYRSLNREHLLDKKATKRVLSNTDASDTAILEERAALARNRAKLECGILSHPTHSRMGEAYLSSIFELLPLPAGARVKKQSARSSDDQPSLEQQHIAYQDTTVRLYTTTK